jgi:hypothetical protein
MILKWILGRMDCMDWILLAEERDQWRALVNMEMNIRVTRNVENPSIAERLAASEEGLSSMKLVTSVDYSTLRA